MGMHNQKSHFKHHVFWRWLSLVVIVSVNYWYLLRVLLSIYDGPASATRWAMARCSGGYEHKLARHELPGACCTSTRRDWATWPHREFPSLSADAAPPEFWGTGHPVAATVQAASTGQAAAGAWRPWQNSWRNNKPRLAQLPVACPCTDGKARLQLETWSSVEQECLDGAWMPRWIPVEQSLESLCV